MFQTIKRGWALTKVSFRVIQQDKELLLFPVISGIGLLIAFFGFAGLGYGLHVGAGFSDNAMIGVFLAYYFVSYFITIYFNTAMISAARIRLDGGDPTVSDGFKGANSRIGKILGWTLVAATVGLILQILQNLARDERNIIGQILAQIAGVAWSVVTYFVLPVIVTENVGPIDSIKRSATVMKRTWGESLTGHVGIGVLFFVLGLLGLIPLVAGAYLAAGGLAVVGAVLILVAFLYWIALIVVNSAANQVLVATLYRYATQGDAGGVLSNQAAENVFNPRADWSQYTDPSTGRIRGA